MLAITKAALRDLYFNKSRSLVVILAIMMITAFPIALTNVTPNLENIILEEQEEYHLAHYNFFFDNFTDVSIEDKLATWSSDFLQIDTSLIDVQGRIHITTKYQSVGNGEIDAGSWIDLDFLSIDNQNPYRINQVIITEGEYPTNPYEVLMLESLAKIENYNLGDNITLFGPTGSIDLKIVGFLKSIEYSSYQLSNTGVIYTNYETLTQYLGRTIDGTQFNSIMMYFDYDVSVEDLRGLYEYLAQKILEDDTIPETLVFTWFTRETSFRKSMQEALEITSQYLIIASTFIFLVAGVIIFVTMNRYVNEQKRVIGSLYAFGSNKWNLVKSFFVRIFVLSLIGIAIGMILAKIFLIFIVGELVNTWGLISIKSDIGLNTVILNLLISSIICYGFTLLALLNIIRMTPYEAMRGKTSDLKNSGLAYILSALAPNRLVKFAGRNLSRNRTRTILTVIAFCLSITFSGSLLYTRDSVGQTIDDYFDDKIYYDMELNMGYPDTQNQSFFDELLELDINNNGVPDVSNYELYTQAFIPFANEPDKLTFMMGIQSNTTMMDRSPSSILQGRWNSYNTSEIVVSKYMEGNFGLEIGGNFSFLYLGKIINTTVVGIVNELMLSSVVILDLQYLTNLYQEYLPTTYFANRVFIDLEEEVDAIEFQNYLNSNYVNVEIALTKFYYKQRFESLTDSQTIIIDLLILLGLLVAFISIFTTMLISIAEREKELSLYHVFGNYHVETFIQIFIEAMLLAIIGLIPGIYLAYYTSENIWIEILSESFFVITPFFFFSILLVLVALTGMSVIVSSIISFRFTTKRKIAEIIREE